MMTVSKLAASEIFDVDRLTIYAWLRRGCPAVDLGGPGRPAKLDFEAVLAWRKEDLAEYYSPEGLKLMARQARARYRRLNKRKA